MLHLEEVQQWKDVRNYTIKKAVLFKDRKSDPNGNTRFKLRVGLIKKLLTLVL